MYHTRIEDITALMFLETLPFSWGFVKPPSELENERILAGDKKPEISEDSEG